ncbi:hypothetical protein TRFO_01858 [Tritrichomonas foetus]|uniref:Uncharacterized protein n=1 Tax=Tritrichomonas foetus TaxID=1144522 RepID=A0A1J4JNG8_9EUKA|nr:hypothetical protein TRFO_01858 [Tritrichomonas foetus]|eukprot:OHS98804.1 hypothetical protein TRFO_01858 [Tritrichomonas foetus]
MKLLLKDKRTNVNATTPTGATALHLAATYASVDAVKLIIEHPKCNKYIENEQGKTPYDFAMQNNLSEKALLLRKIDEDDE